jgi:biotin carboxylase
MAGDDRRKNIFVIGLDEFHERQLESVHHAERYHFHPLLTYEEVVTPERYDMQRLIDNAVQQLESFDGPIDGVIGHWDFPTTSLLPILGRRFDLRTPTLEATLRCEHKYWSRIEQKRVVPEMVPAFDVVDPFDDDAWEKLEVRAPFWIKPVKAFSSYLGFRVDDRNDFEEAMRRTRQGIDLIAEPFDWVLEQAGDMGDLPAVSGWHCIAEGFIGGHQCTLEGYVFEGDAVVYGVIDSIRASNSSSFLRYEYPSELPEGVQERMREATRRIMRAIGYDNGCFNIEFYYDDETDGLKVLEINPRLSKSHCPLFQLVAGASHHEAAIGIAIGRRPEFPRHDGKYRHAAKFMLRRFEDGIVQSLASPEEVQRIEREHPGVLIKLAVDEGQRLSDLRPQDQDSYSYEVGVIFIGSQSLEQLREKYLEVLDALHLEYDDGQGDVAEAAAP